jgi:hypothetical protein
VRPCSCALRPEQIWLLHSGCDWDAGLTDWRLSCSMPAGGCRVVRLRGAGWHSNDHGDRRHHCRAASDKMLRLHGVLVPNCACNKGSSTAGPCAGHKRFWPDASHRRCVQNNRCIPAAEIPAAAAVGGCGLLSSASLAPGGRRLTGSSSTAGSAVPVARAWQALCRRAKVMAHCCLS